MNAQVRQRFSRAEPEPAMSREWVLLLIRKRRRQTPAPLPRVSATLVATVDVDIADVTAGVDVAPPRQVGRRVVAVAERAIGAIAVLPVVVLGVTAAARDTANAHAVACRRGRSDCRHSAIAGGRDSDERTEDRTKAGPVCETVLHSRRALLRGEVRVHPISAIATVAVAIVPVAVVVAVGIILRGR